MTSLAATIAANRYGLGARPGEITRIGGDPAGWLLDQVHGDRPSPAAVAGLEHSATLLARFQKGLRDAIGGARVVGRRDTATRPTGTEAPEQAVRSVVRRDYATAYLAQVHARVTAAVTSDTPFRERLVHFWSNHFAVSADKLATIGIAGAFENEVVRPHVGGRFVELLLAAERHPAMLLYLDNQRSAGPNSRLVRRAERIADDGVRLGLNENLAREILELHTLGVDGGYDQRDVVELAKALTGWSVGGGSGPLREGTPGRFAFREAFHEPGARRLLGIRYPEDDQAQAGAMLGALARHPATARHLAYKLTRHFVADEPPPALVETVARAYRDSDGDLPTVYAALIDARGGWQVPFAKYKSPDDFVFSALRAVGEQPMRAPALVATFESLGQRTYSPGSPAGWPDTHRDWDGADALLARVEWSMAAAERIGDGVDARRLAPDVLGAALGDHTRTAIARAESGAQALALLLSSPDFQRR